MPVVVIESKLAESKTSKTVLYIPFENFGHDWLKHGGVGFVSRQRIVFENLGVEIILIVIFDDRIDFALQEKLWSSNKIKNCEK